MLIIPAIDIIEGKCVRLTKGDYNTKKIYNENPLDVAKQFEDVGIVNLHLVDLDGAKAGRIINWKVLEKIANNTQLKIDVGGGLKSDKDLQIVFECGAKQITGGSIAVQDKPLFASWVKKYGKDKIILGADVKDEEVMVSGWLKGSGIKLFDFIQEYIEKGIKNIICTDINKDGLLEGPATDLYDKIQTQFPSVNLIASGGVANIDDVALLEEKGLYGVIIGKAIYEHKIRLKELMSFSK